MGSWVINTLVKIVPAAASKANLVSKSLYNEATTLLSKMADSLAWVQTIEKETGQNITLKRFLEELEKKLDEKEKATIDAIQKQLGY